MRKFMRSFDEQKTMNSTMKAECIGREDSPKNLLETILKKTFLSL